MFHFMRNTTFSGTRALRRAVGIVEERLPPRWRIEASLTQREPHMTIVSPDGQRGTLALTAKAHVAPRDVAGLKQRFEDRARTTFLFAPFLSPRTRVLLTEAGIHHADATGNLRLVMTVPGIFLEGRGADRSEHTSPRTLKSLKGAAAGRVVRALADFLPPFGIRQLAEASLTPVSTVSRVVDLLDSEALLTRDAKKRIEDVDWVHLLERWIEDYSLTGSNLVVSHLEPRGVPALLNHLSRLDRYAVTGSLAATGVTSARLAMVFVEDAIEAAEILELEPVDDGANVWLIEPFDAVVFDRTRWITPASRSTPIVTAAPTQVVADLWTSPGRGPQEASALIQEMRRSENAWRTDP